MITHPPLKLGAGLRGPKVGGDPQKSPTFGFRGSECFPPLVVHDGAYKNWKYNSRLTGGVLPPNPKNHQNCGKFSERSGRQIRVSFSYLLPPLATKGENFKVVFLENF